jgi:hypothetical protein
MEQLSEGPLGSTRAQIILFKYNQQDATLYNIIFIVNALHVSGGFSAHHQELKNCTHNIWHVPGLLAATVSMVEFHEFQINHAASKPGTYQMLCVQFLSS